MTKVIFLYLKYLRTIMIPLFLVPLFVGGSLQVIKMLIDYKKEGRFSVELLRRAGGVPSVHSAISSSITCLMFLHYGYNSPYFAIAFTFSFLFWYDAMNVRYEAGKHAKHINQISVELQDILEFGESHISLKERLGHTLEEVLIGIFTGSILTTIIYFLLFR